MRKYLSLPLLIIVVIVVVVIALIYRANRPVSLGPQSPSAGTGGLKVDPGGQQIFSGAGSEELQPASPPAKSATNAELNPQQTSPDYCLPGEAPYLDGCVPSQ